MKTIRVTIRFGERDKRKRIRSVRFLREHDMAWKRFNLVPRAFPFFVGVIPLPPTKKGKALGTRLEEIVAV